MKYDRFYAGLQPAKCHFLPSRASYIGLLVSFAFMGKLELCSFDDNYNDDDADSPNISEPRNPFPFTLTNPQSTKKDARYAVH